MSSIFVKDSEPWSVCSDQTNSVSEIGLVRIAAKNTLTFCL